MRAIGYVRVSTEQQGASGAGLAAQRASVEAACTAKGWDVVEVVEDVASGKSLNRPGLAGALSRLDGGEADVLVAAKLDRVSRSVIDFCELVARARRKGWSLRVLDMDLDMTTPQGEMMATVLAAMAQFERRLIGVRTAEALAARRAAGVRLGRPVCDPRGDRAVLAANIRAARADGATWRSIARRLNDLGVPTMTGTGRWHPAAARRVAAPHDPASAE